MRHGRSSLLRREIRRLQLKIPARLPVGVIDQHHPRLHLQAWLLPLDNVLILRNKALAEEFQYRRHRKPTEQIPGGDKIQAAKIAPDRRDRRAIREPICAAADLLGAHIRQFKIDLRCNLIAIKPQQFVRTAVGRRRVRTHAEAVGNRLKRFLLFTNAAPAAPPPGLMHEGAMRRVHQANDSRVHAAREVGGKMCDAIALTEFRQLRNGRNRGSIHLPDGQALGVREIYPHISIAFFAGKAARENAIALELGIRRDGRNLSTLPRVCVKSPTVVGAFDRLPIAMARRKWKRAVRADIAQRKGFARRVASENQRNFESRRSCQRAPANFVAWQRRIPEAPQ